MSEVSKVSVGYHIFFCVSSRSPITREQFEQLCDPPKRGATIIQYNTIQYNTIQYNTIMKKKEAWFISEKILLLTEGTFDTIRDSGFGIRNSGFGIRAFIQRMTGFLWIDYLLTIFSSLAYAKNNHNTQKPESRTPNSEFRILKKFLNCKPNSL